MRWSLHLGILSALDIRTHPLQEYDRGLLTRTITVWVRADVARRFIAARNQDTRIVLLPWNVQCRVAGEEVAWLYMDLMNLAGPALC